jgi:hypothetical protein
VAQLYRLQRYGGRAETEAAKRIVKLIYREKQLFVGHGRIDIYRQDTEYFYLLDPSSSFQRRIIGFGVFVANLPQRI